jgi:putative intracellular protease/amidase
MSVTSKKVLFVVTSHDRKGSKPSGFYLSEVTHPHQVLSDGGYEIDFVSPKGGKAPIDPDSMDLTDGANADFWNDSKLRAAIENTKTPSDVKADDYAGIFFAGGHGAMWDLPNDAAIAALTANIFEHGGVVAAVCHGPAGIVNVKLANGDYLVKDMYVAAFTNAEEREVGLDREVPFLLADELEKHGAHHDPGPNWGIKVCCSGHLVTGQNPASATRVGDAMRTMLDNRNH